MSVDLEGKIDNLGSLKLEGTLIPFAIKQHLDLKLDLKNVHLSRLSPYSAQFVGKKIDQGKLSFGLSFLIENRKLQNDNSIYLDQPIIGGQVESQNAIELPLKLAVGLLKDRSGAIDIKIPVTGDLDDPKFSYGNIIGKALINLVTKIVASPFSLLGSLVDVEGDELQFVEFKPNDTELEESQREKLSKLAEALKQRPDLKLEIQGAYDLKIDGYRLQEVKLASLLKSSESLENSGATSKGSDIQPKLDREKLLELYTKFFSPEGDIELLQNEHRVSSFNSLKNGDKSNEFSEEEVNWETLLKTIREQLTEAQEISIEELKVLAEKRSYGHERIYYQSRRDFPRIYQCDYF